ncbi:MAG: regulatory protein RecX [Bacteroidales bacterium]
MKSLTQGEALHKAAAYCSKSEHCISEIREKLKQWGTESEDVEPIITRLLKEKFIDENRYCRSFINDKYKYNRWGRIKIGYALRMKKIPDYIVYESMDEVIDEELYRQNLIALLREKKRSAKGINKQEEYAKLFRFAASRGFDCSEISKAIKEMTE